jgi:small neutral amino acid transporter SnatA (MarC family)
MGPRGLRACERLMGMVLTVVAVQMSLDGIRLFMGHNP